MTATPVQTTLEERVLEWTEDYCEALAENYKRYHLKSMKYLNAQSGSEYSRKEIEATENGTANLMKFRIQLQLLYLLCSLRLLDHLLEPK